MAIVFILASLIILVLLVNLTIKFTRILSRTKSLNLPPGSYGWPILGETLEFLRAGLDGTPEKFVKERSDTYKSQVFKTFFSKKKKKVFKTLLMGENMAVFCGPSGNKFLFSNENMLVTVWWPSSVRQLLGPCLATSGGDEGKQMRKMVSYFLGPDAFTRLYIKTMDLVSQQHIKNHWLGKEEVKVFPTSKSYTFELACRLFMSLEDPKQISELAALFNIFLKGIISIPVNFIGTRFYNAKKATFAIKNQLREIVRQRRAALECKRAAPWQDLLSHLLATPDENGKFMSESVIVNNIIMLLFAGHDTSSVAITMMMKNLAEIPEVYEKVLKEQMEIASSKGGEYLEREDIQKMRQLRSEYPNRTRTMDSSMEDSRVAPTTIDLQLLVIDSKAKREKMRILWYVLSMYLWSLYSSILIVWTSASSMKIFRKGEGFYILLGLTVVASVMSVYICTAAIGIIFYIRLLHTQRFDILRTWSLSKPLTILFGPVDFDAILLPLRRPDDHHASVTEESLHSSSMHMGDSHGVLQAAVNIDSNTKKELMNEYRSKLETGIGLTLFLMFPAGMMGYVVFGGQKQVLPVFLAATVTVGVNFIVVMGKACLLLLFYFGCQDCVRALSQNAFVILLFDTINANGIFQRIQDHHQPSPLVTLPV